MPRYTRIWLNDPKAIFVEKVVKAEIRRELTPIPALAKQEVMPPTAPSFTHAAPEAIPESAPVSTPVKGEPPSAATSSESTEPSAGKSSTSAVKEPEASVAKEEIPPSRPAKGSPEWIRLEATAAQTLEKIQTESSGAHFLSRHGAQTTREQQYLRATKGVRPDVRELDIELTNSTRFLSHQDQLEAVRKAEELFKQTGKRTFSFEIGPNPIGEGYLAGEQRSIREGLQTTNIIRAVFRNGRLYTLYPLLEKL